MKHKSTLRVRFSDTDMLGHVNNASYFTYMEEARLSFFQENVKFDGIPLILASAKVDFRAQTFYTQTLVLYTWISRMGNSSFDMSCTICDEQTGKLLFEGVAVMVYFDYETQRPKRVPDELREQLAPYIERTDPAAKA